MVKFLLVKRVTGTVEWFSVKDERCFMNVVVTGEDVFVHHTAVTYNNQQKTNPRVRKGEMVDFAVVTKKREPQTSKVTRRDGAPVKGSLYAAKIGRFRNCLLSGRRQHHPIDSICCGAGIGGVTRMAKSEQPSSSQSRVSSAVSPSGRFRKSCRPLAHYENCGMQRGNETHRGGHSCQIRLLS